VRPILSAVSGWRVFRLVALLRPWSPACRRGCPAGWPGGAPLGAVRGS